LEGKKGDLRRMKKRSGRIGRGEKRVLFDDVKRGGNWMRRRKGLKLEGLGRRRMRKEES